MALIETIGTLLSYNSVGNLDYKSFFGYGTLTTIQQVVETEFGNKLIPSTIVNAASQRRYRLIMRDGITFPTNLTAYSEANPFLHSNEEHTKFFDDNHRVFVVNNINNIGDSEDANSYIPFWKRYTLQGDVLIDKTTDAIYVRNSVITSNISLGWDFACYLGGDSILGLVQPDGVTNFIFNRVDETGEDDYNGRYIEVSFTNEVSIPKTLNIGTNPVILDDDELLNIHSGKLIAYGDRIVSKYEDVVLQNATGTKIIDINYGAGSNLLRVRNTTTEQALLINEYCTLITTRDINSRDYIASRNVSIGGTLIVTGITTLNGKAYVKNDLYVGSAASGYSNSVFSVDITSKTIYGIADVNIKDTTSKQLIIGNTSKLTIHKDFYVVNDEAGTESLDDAGVRGDKDTVVAISVNDNIGDIEGFGDTFVRGDINFGVSTEHSTLVTPKKLEGYGNIEIKKNVVEGSNNIKRRSGHSTIEGFGRTGLQFVEGTEEDMTEEIAFDISKGNILHIIYAYVLDGKTLTITLEDYGDGTNIEAGIGGSFTIIVESKYNTIGSEGDSMTIIFDDSRFIKVDTGDVATLNRSSDVVVYSGLISGKVDLTTPGSKVRFMGSISKPIGNLLAI